jgi:hypothetical protein
MISGLRYICSMKHYRFRARFRVDVEIVMSLLPDAMYEIRPLHGKQPDVEVDMITFYDLQHVIDTMKRIHEGEIMHLTIAPAKKYRNTFEPDGDFSLN